MGATITVLIVSVNCDDSQYNLFLSTEYFASQMVCPLSACPLQILCPICATSVQILPQTPGIATRAISLVQPV